MPTPRTKRLATRVVALTSLIVALLPVIGTAAAKGDSAITHLWSQPLRETNQLIVGPTGSDIGIDENCDWAGGDTAYQDFTADGSQHWALSNSGNQQPWCGANSFIDATGNTYLYMHDGPANTGNGQRLSSYDATGALRWTDLVVGGGGGVQRFAMGFDGNLYALYDYNKVLRVNPTTGSGLTMGYIQDPGSDITITTYASGLVVAGYGSARSYNYSGTRLSAMNVDPALSTGPITFGAGGGTYMSGCSAAGLGGATYAAPASTLGWTWFEPLASSTGCGSVRIASTPDGGAVVSVMNKDDTRLTYYGVSPNGASRWTHVITPPGGASPFYSYMYAQPVADINGTVVLPSEFTASGVLCVNDQCPFARVEFVNQTTGANIESPLDLPANVVGPQIEITKGQLYAADQSWISATGSLDAYSFPRLGNNYQTTLEPGLAMGAIIAAPSQSDPVLTRRLLINLSVGAAPAASYEYGWLPPGSTRGAPTQPVQTCTQPQGRCTLSYADTTPNQSGWTLFVRGLSATGVIGPWIAATGTDGATSIQIPSTPVLVALGDSITAGHHRLSDTATATCEDPDYGYPAYAWNALEKKLPPQWQGTGYYNFAVSGFGTQQVLQGGKDACGRAFTGAQTPITMATSILHAHQSSWTRVVITAGINDTNWISVLGTIAQYSVLGTNVAFNSTACSVALAKWNGSYAQNSAVLNAERNAGKIVDSLRSGAGAQSTQIFWLGYYNIAPAAPGVPPIPASCGSPFSKATTSLNGYIRTGLGSRTYRWIDMGNAIKQNPSLIQRFLPTDTLSGATSVPAGWPHPDAIGAAAIAAQINLAQ